MIKMNDKTMNIEIFETGEPAILHLNDLNKWIKKTIEIKITKWDIEMIQISDWYESLE